MAIIQTGSSLKFAARLDPDFVGLCRENAEIASRYRRKTKEYDFFYYISSHLVYNLRSLYIF